jgi:hypothetical protein
MNIQHGDKTRFIKSNHELGPEKMDIVVSIAVRWSLAFSSCEVIRHKNELSPQEDLGRFVPGKHPGYRGKGRFRDMMLLKVNAHYKKGACNGQINEIGWEALIDVPAGEDL